LKDRKKERTERGGEREKGTKRCREKVADEGQKERKDGIGVGGRRKVKGVVGNGFLLTKRKFTLPHLGGVVRYGML
jgi:hypothetical protein